MAISTLKSSLPPALESRRQKAITFCTELSEGCAYAAKTCAVDHLGIFDQCKFEKSIKARWPDLSSEKRVILEKVIGKKTPSGSTALRRLLACSREIRALVINSNTIRGLTIGLSAWSSSQPRTGISWRKCTM